MFRGPWPPPQSSPQYSSGEPFGSSVSNIVQGRIPKNVVRDKPQFNSRHMWHSSELPSGWATVELEFPEPVTLDKIDIYSQHTGKNHEVVAAKVFTVSGGKTKLQREAEDLKPVSALKFKQVESRKWQLELKAGRTNKVVVRGLRFFNGKRELYPPISVPE